MANRDTAETTSNFVLELHTNSEDNRPVYVVGNFNQWRIADQDYKMKAIAPGQFRLELPSDALPHILEYKYARGNWDYVELDTNGQERPNRKVSLQQGFSMDKVKKWRTDRFKFSADLLPKIEVIEEDFDIPGSIRTRRIAAILPFDYYQSNKQYPVLYLQDGQNLYDDYAPYGNWAVDKRMAQLQADGQGDVIIIAIDHAMDKRIVEYTPHATKTKLGKGEGRQYIRFLAETLKPYIDSRFRTLSDWKNTGIGGSSMGGLVSIYAGLMYPNIYGRLMIFSPSLWVTPRIRFQLLNLKQPYAGRVYLYGGNKESETMVANLKRLQAALEAQDVDTKPVFKVSIDPQGKHNEAHWSKEFIPALKWLFFEPDTKTNAKQEGMKIQFNHILDTVNGLLIIPIKQDKGKAQTVSISSVAKYCGLDEAIIHKHFSAAKNEQLPLLSSKGEVILLGLGGAPSFASILKVFRLFSIKQNKKFGHQLNVSWLHHNAPMYFPLWCEAATNGLWQGTYFTGQQKTETNGIHSLKKNDFLLNFLIPSNTHVAAKKSCSRALKIAAAQCEMMALVNAPGNYKTAVDIAKWAEKSAKTYGYNCEIWDKKRILKEGMHALLAVNQGSEEPPAFIILEYKPKTKKHLPKIGLVGKGVTFDTGGLSIKPSTNMHFMKSDMGGAAAVLGTIEAAARLKLPVHLIGIVPATDNVVDAKSVKPGDVISSYSGKTIEIIDTDAEGRLVLADGLSYIIRNHNPDLVIDLATLTGSSVRTLGYEAGALFSNDKQLVHHLEESGRQCGERLWQLPLWDEYGESLSSDVADIKNFSGQPIAGASSAAKFLEFFTEEHPSWAHLDIAGVAFGDSDFAKGKAATGYGIRLLINFIENIIKK